MMNMFQKVMQFASMAKQQHGDNFDPAQMSKNMLGKNYSSPQEALQDLVDRNVISRDQYNTFIKII